MSDADRAPEWTARLPIRSMAPAMYDPIIRGEQAAAEPGPIEGARRGTGGWAPAGQR
jgi:hypothetical protein